MFVGKALNPELLKQFWDERLKSETYQQPWGNTHTTTTIQGEGCYRSQVYSRQTNKGSRFLCNGSLEFSTAQHSTTQLRGSLVFSERRGPNNTRIKPNTKEPVSIFKLDKYVLTYMQTGTILQNDHNRLVPLGRKHAIIIISDVINMQATHGQDVKGLLWDVNYRFYYFSAWDLIKTNILLY